MSFSSAKILFVVNEPYFFVSHRLPLACAALREGYEVHVAAPDDNIWAPLHFHTVQFFEEQGIIFHNIPLSRRGLNVFQEITTLCSLYQLYKHLKPQIVHHITAKAILYGGISARLAKITASVAAFPGLGHYFTHYGLFSRFMRLVLMKGYRFVLEHPNSWAIFQNPDDLAVLFDSKDPLRQRATITRGSGVCLGKFVDRPQSTGIPIVTLSARLIWEKGIAEFVEVARRLKAKGVSARFVLVGNTHPSNPRAVPITELEKWQNEGLVEWWGRREDMPQILSESRIVCLPSTYGEGVPKVLMEAAASGRPVVTFDMPGCREAIIHGVTGLLVTVGNIDELASSVKFLIENPELCRTMGQAGRDLAEKEFGVDQVISQTLSIYRRLLGDDTKPSLSTKTIPL